jgi:hypothetical protein
MVDGGQSFQGPELASLIRAPRPEKSVGISIPASLGRTSYRRGCVFYDLLVSHTFDIREASRGITMSILVDAQPYAHQRAVVSPPRRRSGLQSR